jgi:tRNA threonylcarbamoyl adenosine modification protein YeaZ
VAIGWSIVLILAFDTATPAVTVALSDGTGVLAEVSSVDPRRPGELLSAAIEKVLGEAGADRAELTSIAVGTGPGPYTGLRAGLVTARVLASVLAIPADGICTLDILACGAEARVAAPEFLVATDARRREVYWARYSASGERLAGPHVGSPAELPPGLPVAGEGALLYDLPGDAIEPRYPSAAWLAEMAAERISARTPPAPPEPLYLRSPDARVPGPPKRVTP